MLSLQRLHLRQAEQSPQSKAEVPEWHGMPHESAKGIGSAAFHSVCFLKAVASSSQNPKEIGRVFLLWWRSTGYGLVLGGGEHEPVTADDEWDDFPSEDECEPVAGEEVLTLQNLDLQAASCSSIQRRLWLVLVMLRHQA